jgi:hypothetical protein
MYSLTGRLNSIAFNTLIALTILSAANFLTAYFTKVQPTNIKFKAHDAEVFVNDRFIKEDAISFTFDLDADLTKVYNWNTNLLFVYLTCEFVSEATDFNLITIWD